MKQSGLILALFATASVAFGAPTKNPAQASVKAAPAQPVLAAAATPTTQGQFTEAPSITTTLPSAPVSGITGFLDLRPAVDLSSAGNDARLETSVGLGYKFTKDVSITAEQPFWSNINGQGPNSLTGTIAREGHVRLDVKNIAKSGIWSLGYQARVYYPSRAAWRDNGFLTQIRNAFYVTAQISPAFSLSFFEVPIVHVFDKSFGPGGVNPAFENRIVIAPELSLMGGKLSVSCPIFFHAFKNRNGDWASAEARAAADARVAVGPKRSAADIYRSATAVSGFAGGPDEWWYSLWISPEIMYNVTKEVQLGVSYDSADFLKPDFSAFTPGDAFTKGVPKLAFRMTL